MLKLKKNYKHTYADGYNTMVIKKGLIENTHLSFVKASPVHLLKQVTKIL